MFFQSVIQARNQLGTPGVAKSFLGGAQIFLNNVQHTELDIVKNFFQRGKKISTEGLTLLRPRPL